MNSSGVRPPPHFWSYVFPANRAGVLASLGVAMRREESSGGSVVRTLDACAPALKDALRAYLSQEPAKELDDFGVHIARQLPIFRAFVLNAQWPKQRQAYDQQEADRASAALAAAAAGRDEEDNEDNEEAKDESENDAVVKTYPRLMDATRFACAQGRSQDNAPSSPSSSTAQQHHHQQPVYLLESISAADADLASEAFLGPMPREEVELATRLGVATILRPAFYTQHVFPRLPSIPPAARDPGLVAMLLDASRLGDQSSSRGGSKGGDANFLAIVSKTPFVPTRSRPVPSSLPAATASAGANSTIQVANSLNNSASAYNVDLSANVSANLQAPCALFDPNVLELQQLVDPSLFPDSPFDSARALVALRSLGLQSGLDWQGVVRCATAVQAAADSAAAAAISTGTTATEEVDPSANPTTETRGQLAASRAAAERGRLLLAFIDAQAPRLFGHEAESRANLAARNKNGSGGGGGVGGLWGSIKSAAASAVGLGAAEREAAEAEIAQRNACLAQLRHLRWLPVHTSPLEPYLPWRGLNSTATAAAGVGAAAGAMVSDDGAFPSQGAGGTTSSNSAIGATNTATPTVADEYAASVTVGAPCEMRPASDMWLGSHTYLCLSPACGPLASRDLLEGLGWDAPLRPQLAAAQLRGVAQRYAALTRTSASGGNDGADGETNSSSTTDNKRGSATVIESSTKKMAVDIVELQQVMAAAVPKLYACLDGLSAPSDVAAMRDVLGAMKWLWVGSHFVTADQVRSRMQQRLYMYECSGGLVMRLCVS